ncbi:MAG: Mur ligase domain-containing protein [Chloroflexi bacterium]|nr:Mur ligase domain-containing protein [Chloroflexota bacterium]
MVTGGERIHVIGIAGSGAAGAAVLLQDAGARVDGCDIDAPSPYTPALDAAGISFALGHDASHLAGIDRVAITPALRAVPDHAELAAAIERGIPVATWEGPPSRQREAGSDRRGRCLHRRLGRIGPAGSRSSLRGGGGRVRRQLPELPPRCGHRDQHRDGPP